MTLFSDSSRKSHWVRLGVCSLFGSAFALLSSSAQSFATQIYFDNECKVTTSAVMERGGAFRVEHTFQLDTKKGNRVFYAARYGDGSGLFCVSKPGKPNAKKITVPFQMGFFDNVTQKNSKTILIEIRDGNGFNTPVTLYQLRFKNPAKPKVKALKTWIANPR